MSFVPLSLRRNFSWTFVGKIVYAACQWGMLIALVRLGTVEMVGQYALGLALTAPIILFANLQLRSLQASDPQQDYGFGDYLRLRAATTIAAFALIVVIAVILPYSRETVLVILLIAVAKAIESMEDIYHGFFQRLERLDYVAKSALLRGVGSLTAFIVGLLATRELFVALALQSLAWVLILFFYDRKNALRLGARVHVVGFANICTRLWSLARLGLPLGIVALLTSLNPNIPRYIVEAELGLSALGVFAALAYVVVAGSTVVAALSQTALPRLAKLTNTGEQHGFVSLFLKCLIVGIGVGLTGVTIAIVLGSPLLTLLYGEEYAAHQSLFTWIMVAAAFSYLGFFTNAAMVATRMINVQVPLYICVISVTTLTSLIAIPAWGLQGAATALLLGGITHVTLSSLLIFLKLRHVEAVISGATGGE